MSIPAFTFKGLLMTLAGQFINSHYGFAECVEDDFGGDFHQNAKKFFSIELIETDLPKNLAAVGLLCDDSVSPHPRKAYTFFIYIDSSKKYLKITDDLKTILSKLFLSHEVCHFAFYYELYLSLGADLTETLYEKFQNIVSGKLKSAITREKDITSQTVVEEHSYDELLKNFNSYRPEHFSKGNPTHLEYRNLLASFFDYLTSKL
jgi:hypothetical protein